MSAPKPDFRALGEALAREEDALLARHPGPAVFRGPRETSRAQAWRWPAVWTAAAASLAVAVAIFVVRARPLDLTVDGKAEAGGRWISATHDAPIPIRFSDGTEVMLAPDANARVLDVTQRGAHLMMESGAAHVSVMPNRGGQWTFSAGPFRVEVKGTRFELAWSPKEQVFVLALVEGSVAISGCAVGEGRMLFAGETLRASCLSNEFHIDRVSSAAPSTTAVMPAPAAPDLPSPPQDEPLAPQTTPPADAPIPSNAAPRTHASSSSSSSQESWQSLARASRFKDALARVNERGFDGELARASRDDLVLLGDVARLSGDSAHAIAAYQRARSRAPGSDAAANAAFSMGRVYFDQREAFAEAARWFATYRSERADGPLARDAMGRQMEALSRAGDAAAASRIAEDYVKRYPTGPHAPLARTLRADAK